MAAENGALSVSGFVASEADKSDLAAKLSALSGVSSVTADLVIVPRPFCEVRAMLDELALVGGAGIGAPVLQLNHADLAYRAGDKFVVKVKASDRFAGYLYLDFIDSEGSVVHLLWTPSLLGSRVLAGQELTAGARGELVASPPFGENLLIAISSRRPLFSALRPEVERGAVYFPALRQALASAAPGGEEGLPLASFVSVAVNPAN